MTALLDQLGPDLYRQNAFRITGLRVDATTRDIRRWSQEWQVKNRLGADMPTGSTALPLEQPPDESVLQQALQRLRDPSQRIVDEIFWFWPLAYGETDAAMAAVDRGDLDAAAALWTSQVTPIGVHNLAVLHHARALDAATLDEDAEREWSRAFMNWSALLSGDGFWNFLRARIRDLGDARLTPGRAGEIREELAAALPLINATLASRAARNGRRDEAVRYVALLRDAGRWFGEDEVERALGDAVAPEAARVRTLCKNAEDVASADPRKAAGAARDLLDRARPVLDELAAMLEPGHTLLQGAQDEVARRGLLCVIAYTNKTEKWNDARELLERIRTFAATDTIRERIDRDLTTIKGQLVYANCWFCKENPAVDAHAHGVKMHGDVVRQYGRVTWRKLSIQVPRCATCAAAHSRDNAKGYGVGCGGTIGVVAADIAAFAAHQVALGILGILAAIAVFVIGMKMTTSMPTLKEFPPIRDQLAKGWRFGEKPPT